MDLWQQEKIYNNVINNKESAEQIFKAFKNINDKLQIRVMWTKLNTTEG